MKVQDQTQCPIMCRKRINQVEYSTKWVNEDPPGFKIIINDKGKFTNSYEIFIIIIYHYKNAKIGCGHLKIFIIQTTEPEKLKFTWELPGPWGSDRATIGETFLIFICIGKLFENLLLKNHPARKAQLYIWILLEFSADWSLLKSWLLGGRVGPQ